MSRTLYLFMAFGCYAVVIARETSAQEILVVDFVQSMLCVAQYTDAGVATDLTSNSLSDWQAFAALYDTYMLTDKMYAQQARIPKIVHHIWLGSPLPDRCKGFIATWKKHHPDWVFMLWDEASVAQLNLINQKSYESATNYGEKSDIARYEILDRFGGLYIDTDFECLHSFDLLHHCCDFYTGAYANLGSEPCYVFNGLLASRPGHPVLKRCIQGIQEQANKASAVYYDDIINRTGPYYLTRCLKEAIAYGDDIGRCVPFPSTYFYPWPAVVRFNRNRDFIEQFIRPESLAIHHWASSWL